MNGFKEGFALGLLSGFELGFEEIGAFVGILPRSSIMVLQNLPASSLSLSPSIFSKFPVDEPTPRVKAERNILVIKNCMVNCYY